MLDPKDPYKRSFSSLSIKDLLDAREAYHVHLMRMENVFSTAIGLYRIQEHDLDYKQYHPAGEAAAKERGKKNEPRTLENTVVKPWSWPCVLVFVKEWLKPADYHAAMLKGQVVPPFLDLPSDHILFCGIALGFGDEGAAINRWRAPRAGVDEFATFRGFSG